MKKIKIEEKTYNVPENWKDITLRSYETFSSIKIENRIGEIQLVSKVSSIPLNVLSNLPLSFYTEILNTICFIFCSISYKPLSFVSDGEYDYYVNTKEELTLAQYVDIENVYSDENGENKLSEILAIVCLKKDEKYLPELLETRKEMFENMPMDKVFPLLTFFLQFSENYNRITELLLIAQERIKRFQKDIKYFRKSGGGKKSSLN
ncbi:hypothetical protein EZS27_018395 [termite gut metagenome]|uniref:Uncharacterized protein n=1 Tax=termite gut metagenome TaxID=433724 RepID=A0A5J4RHR4_9ZZZZ